MIDKKDIYNSFINGSLQVLSVSPDKKVEWKKIEDVMRHDVLKKVQYRVQIESGQSCTVTEDHSLFIDKGDTIEPIRTSDIHPNSDISWVQNDSCYKRKVLSSIIVPSENYMYDLSVTDNHNFVLESGILAHNSFRPPKSSKFIQGQTQVFGFVWEDEELLECIYIAINDANTRPPLTGFTLEDIVTGGGAMGWSSLILVRAAWFANMMQAQRWAVDSFDYSISGVSLNLSDKFTQYTALKDEYGAEFDKMVEQAKLTIKIVKGLRQMKFGIGISSALGPLSRPGVQSRANWISSSRPGSF